jgi:hypothetical protein
MIRSRDQVRSSDEIPGKVHEEKAMKRNREWMD